MGRGSGIRKLILLGFDNHADKHGRGAYPSTQTIADYAECDVRTAQRQSAGYWNAGSCTKAISGLWITSTRVIPADRL
jgi:hypothetical protein